MFKIIVSYKTIMCRERLLSPVDKTGKRTVLTQVKRNIFQRKRQQSFIERCLISLLRASNVIDQHPRRNENSMATEHIQQSFIENQRNSSIIRPIWFHKKRTFACYSETSYKF